MQKNKNKKNPLEISPDQPDKEISHNFQKVAVACSGGLDSSVLFHLLCQQCSQKKNFSLAICHTNFGLRAADSNQDQDFLQELAENKGVDFLLRKVSQDERDNRQSESLQEWARRLRYEHFLQLNRQGWIIATGHHQDDLAENIILRLARGTSPGSMAGMNIWNPPFWRPLLHWTKARLASYAKQHNISYREDITNLSTAYTRNKIRHQIMPLLEDMFPGATNRIARCGLESQEISIYCSKLLTEKIDRLKNHGLPAEELASLPNSIQNLLLSRAIGPAKKRRKSISAKFLKRVREHIRDHPMAPLHLTLPADYGFLEISHGSIRLLPIKPDVCKKGQEA